MADFNIVRTDTVIDLGINVLGGLPELIKEFKPDYRGAYRHPSVKDTEEGLVWFESLYNIDMEKKTINGVLADDVFKMKRVPDEVTKMPSRYSFEDTFVKSPQHWEKRHDKSVSTKGNPVIKEIQYVEIPELSPYESMALIVIQYFIQQGNELPTYNDAMLGESPTPSVRVRMTDFYEACGIPRTSKGYQSKAQKRILQALEDLYQRDIAIKYTYLDDDDQTKQSGLLRFRLISRFNIQHYNSDESRHVKYFELTLDSFLMFQMQNHPYFSLTRLDFYSQISTVASSRNINQLFAVAQWLRKTSGDIILNDGKWIIRRNLTKLLDQLKMESILKLQPNKQRKQFSRYLDLLEKSGHIRTHTYEKGSKGQDVVKIQIDPRYYKNYKRLR